MKRTPNVALAHKALKDHDRGFAEYLLTNVNLTLLEKEIIRKTEIDGLDIESTCMKLESWNKKNDISYQYCARIKNSGMNKIGIYLLNTQDSNINSLN